MDNRSGVSDYINDLIEKNKDIVNEALRDNATDDPNLIKMEYVKTIRKEWAIGDQKRDEGLTTPEEIKRYDNVLYREKLDEDIGINDKANLLDIYVQKNVSGLQPAIINVHGGAFVYGNKEVYQFYCMQLALKGFTVVNINYRLAPECKFPAALEDINSVLSFIEKNGRDYHIDKNQLILIGDSAGAQMVSHYAAIFTNKEYAKKFSFQLPNVMIKALGLNCGLYNMKKILENDSENMFFVYLGKNYDVLTSEEKNIIDVWGHMTKDFPPSFVVSAVNDFFLDEAKAMFQHLERLNIPTRIKIYGTKEQKEIGHVFHVNCRLPEARICNEEECTFFKTYI
ncbi:MAG: alpha/beta hydrolase [Lachnospiraceae bacterium]